jgi:hypothetical protein
MKSQGNHEKNKSGPDIDRKMPAAQLPLANIMHIKMEEQDDWKKDIHKMSKAIKGLVNPWSKGAWQTCMLPFLASFTYSPLS